MAKVIFTSFFFVALLATLSLASAENPEFIPLNDEDDADKFEPFPHILSVERDTIPVTVKSSASSQFGVSSQVGEKSIYAVKETRSGYARIVRSGVSVQIGTTATMHYNKRFRGVSSEKLASLDGLFVQTLSKEERQKYYKKKNAFSGGLDVTFLRFLGINLSGNTNKKSMDKAAQRTKEYNRKAAAAKRILEQLSTNAVTVSGTITAMGVSFRPTTAFAFIEVARVKLSSGQIVTVVSSNKSDLEARTSTGKTLPTTGKKVKIDDEDNYYFEPKA